MTCGLRDYGTATWEGAKNGCNHIEVSVGMSDKNTLGPDKYLPPTNAANVGRKQQFREVCKKCGAKRIDNQLGLEKTPEEYIENTVTWAREVWRVLRKDGTFFLNLGDSYNGSGGAGGDYNKGGLKDGQPKYNGRNISTLKLKDLCGIPWKVAFALQAGFSQCQNCGLELRTDLWPIWNGHKVCFDCRDVDKNVIIQSQQGWYLRSAMPWVKRSAMPESCTDRPASALEYMFLLTKSSKYYFDMDAIRVGQSRELKGAFRVGGNYTGGQSFDNSGVSQPTNSSTHRQDGTGRNFRNTDLFYQSLEEPHGAIFAGEEMVGLDVNPQAYSEAHFATFPDKIPEICIKAGTSEKGACPECGAPWERIIEKEKAPRRSVDSRAAIEPYKNAQGNFATERWDEPDKSKTIGWQPTCKCGHKETVPCVVLDNFGGSGTTKNVADRLGRRGVMCELKMEYIEMAKKRCHQDPSLFA